MTAPDANCYTLPNGDCVGTGCIHDPVMPSTRIPPGLWMVHNMHGPMHPIAHPDEGDWLIRHSKNAGMYRIVNTHTGITERAFYDGREISPVYGRCMVCSQYFDVDDDDVHSGFDGEDIHAECCERRGPCSLPVWQQTSNPLNP